MTEEKIHGAINTAQESPAPQRPSLVGITE